MPFKQTLVYVTFFVLFISSCSRKHVPENTPVEANTTKRDSIRVKKAIAKRIGIPKVIVVNDAAAKISTDGRLYYDLGGHRYWKNYNDGKYYLFNQSMYSNSAFKPH